LIGDHQMRLAKPMAQAPIKALTKMRTKLLSTTLLLAADLGPQFPRDGMGKLIVITGFGLLDPPAQQL